VIVITAINNNDAVVAECVSSSAAIQSIDVSTLSKHDTDALFKTARQMRAKCEDDVGMPWTIRHKLAPLVNSPDRVISDQAREIIKSFGLQPAIRRHEPDAEPIPSPAAQIPPTITPQSAQGHARTIRPPGFLSQASTFVVEMPSTALRDEANAISKALKDWPMIGIPPVQPLVPQAPEVSRATVSDAEIQCFDTDTCALAPRLVDRLRDELGISAHIRELLPESGVGDMKTYHRMQLILPAERLHFKAGVVLPAGTCPECYGY
jgi:hypothetical protein